MRSPVVQIRIGNPHKIHKSIADMKRIKEKYPFSAADDMTMHDMIGILEGLAHNLEGNEP